MLEQSISRIYQSLSVSPAMWQGGHHRGGHAMSSGDQRENGRRCLNRKNRRICHHKQIYFLALKSPFRELGNRGLIDSDVSRPMLWRSERLVQIYRPSMGVSSISVSWFGRYETRETGRGHSVHCALKDSRSFFARSFRKQVISYFKILEWRKYNN